MLLTSQLHLLLAAILVLEVLLSLLDFACIVQHYRDYSRREIQWFEGVELGTQILKVEIKIQILPSFLWSNACEFPLQHLFPGFIWVQNFIHFDKPAWDGIISAHT